MAGGQISIDVVLNDADLARRLDRMMGTATSSIKRAAGAMGVAFGAAGVVAGFEKIITTGRDFDLVMNTIRGTSGATAAEMAQISDKARQLGNDMALPATSASDAATAMLELSKGGLSVKDSMDAARGSLALAAAAQIDAGQAAEIQANAINTFKLKASDAEHVADVLANTANKSSAGIEDIAQALQQGGSVAAGFNMTIEETAGTLGVLANNGIKGSDAGTLLKSALLALQDTGKPAAAAMETLGIKTYDAQGKFVGMGKILEQLNGAHKTLTEEEYNHATSTLFGSDAMRLSTIAAKENADAFSKMTAEVGKSGGASKLAADMNAGLPGALEKIQNAAETTTLSLYELMRGPVTDLANFGAEKLTGLSEWIGDENGLRRVGDALRPVGEDLATIGRNATDAGGALNLAGDSAKAAGNTALAGIKPLAAAGQGVLSVFAGLPVPVQTAAIAMGAFALARNKIATPAPLRAMQQFRGEMATQNALFRSLNASQNNYGASLSRTQQALAAYRSSTIPAVAATRGFTDQVSQIRAGATAAGQPISRLSGTMRAMSERSGNLAAIGQSFQTASANASRFGTAAGLAAGGATAMKVGAGGLISAMGGPFGLALGGAAIALSLYSQKQQQAAEEAARHKNIVDGLVGSINSQTGALSSAGQAQVEANLRGKQYGDKKTNPYDLLSSSKDLGVSNQQYTQAAGGDVAQVAAVNKALDDQVKKSITATSTWGQYQKSLERGGVSADVLTAALRGNKDAIEKVEVAGMGNFGVETFSKSLDGAGKNAVQLGQQLGQANDDLSESQKQAQQQAASLQAADPAARALAESMEVLGNKTASASDKAKALKNALDVLSGGAEAVDAARGQGLAAVEKLPELWQAAADAAGGYGNIVDQTTGRVRVDSDAARALSASINDVKNSMNTAASAAYEYAIKNGQSQDQARQAAVIASQGIYDGFMKTAEGARAAGVDVDALMQQMSLLPPEKAVQFMAIGSDHVKQEIFLIKNQLDQTPDNKPITVTSISDEAKKKLEDIGVTVKTLPDGRVEVQAATDAARKRIDELLKPETKTINVNYNPIQQYAGVPIGVTPNTNTDGIVGGGRRDGGPIGYKVGGGIGKDGAIRGPGTGTSDSISTVAPADGHVFTKREVDAAGGHDQLRERLAAVSSYPGRASASAGPMQNVRLSNGEHFAFPEQVAAAGGHAAIFAFRRSLLNPQKRSLGGLVRAEQVGHANDGLPYITGARDCSMWVSWMVQAAKGEPLQRLFTTNTLIGGQTGGLVPGASYGDLLTVGTSAEHMAATVWTANGPVNTESGGNSSPSQVRWGRGAAGAFDGQFPYKFHLPLNLINPQPQKEATPSDSRSPYIPDAEANRKAQNDISGESKDKKERQYIEPPTPPKLEDVAADAAKIGVRGLLETFGLENSFLADPSKTTIGQAWQIAQNTDRYRKEQSENPSTDDTGTGKGKGRKLSDEEKLAIRQEFENAKLPRDQKYQEQQRQIREKYKGKEKEGVRDQELLKLKQQHDRDELPYKQERDRKLKGLDGSGSGDGEAQEDTGTDGGAGTSSKWGSRTHVPTNPEVTDPYSLVDSAPYDPAKGASQWRKEASASLRIAGMSQSYLQKMLDQGDIESHGDPRAVGPGSSDGAPKGWMQVKDRTFAAMRDPKLPNDPFNVLANGVASAKWGVQNYAGNPPWPTKAGYGDGGVVPLWGLTRWAAGGLNPMAGNKAAVVGPNTWRVVGDRQRNDEFFIPDTDDPQHVAMGAEWARRRGYQLVAMHADGGIAARAAGGQAAVARKAFDAARQEVNNHYTNTYEYSGPASEADAFFRGARRHDNIVRQGAGIARTGRKGSVRR